MRVVIHDAALFDAGDEALYDQLTRLFLRAYQGQHDLEVASLDFDQDIERVVASEFMRIACPPMYKTAWEELLRRTSADPFATTLQNRQVRVVRKLSPTATQEVVVDEVGGWAEKPLRILLENQTDKILVELAAKLVPGKLDQALENEWLEPHGCGGTGEVKKAVERAAPTERIFVIIDSDREDPSERMNAKAQGISEKCAEMGVGIHVLERRELENYVPHAAWEVVVSGEKAKSTPRGNRKIERKALVYSWIARQLDQHDTYLSGKHGTEALEGVRKEIEKNATRDVAPRVLREQLENWARMSMHERAVDDLKERFGKAIAQKAVARMSDENFDHQWLDDAAIKELASVAKKIEEWL